MRIYTAIAYLEDAAPFPYNDQEVFPMIEVHLAYDVLPGIDEDAYFEWMKKAIIPALKSRGIVEVRAQRNVKESQSVMVVGLWEKLEDWLEFSQSEGWHSLTDVLQSTFAKNLRIEVWRPSQLIPLPLRPRK
jgi:hypothetical protein